MEMPETGYFVLTLPLKTEKWQEDVLNKRFEVNREIYNALLRGGLSRYAQMVRTRRYRSLIQKLDAEKDLKERKRIYKELDEMQAQYRLRKFDLSSDATPYRKYFKENTDAPVVQNLSVQVWKALYALMSRQAKAVHPKKQGELRALEGKTNKTSIRFQDGAVFWKGLRLPAYIKGNTYEREALSQEIRYCRIKRKWIRGRECYYVDLVMCGKCPVRNSGSEMVSESNGVYRANVAGEEKETSVVGLDLGLRRITAVSDTEIRTFSLPEKDRNLEQRRRELARKMERSRRINHPENYDGSGQIRSGEKKWHYSNHYRRYREKYRELGRLQRIYREEEQRCLIREIQEMGEVFHAEKLDYQKMKRRNGAVRLGRAVEDTAIAGFLNKLEWKLRQNGKNLIYFDPVKTVSARWNHVTEEKEVCSPRSTFRSIDGILIERQTYSAFLMQHGDVKTGKINAEECRKAFRSFMDIYYLSVAGNGYETGEAAG